jgi:hypothetical protein
VCGCVRGRRGQARDMAMLTHYLLECMGRAWGACVWVHGVRDTCGTQPLSLVCGMAWQTPARQPPCGHVHGARACRAVLWANRAHGACTCPSLCPDPLACCMAWQAGRPLWPRECSWGWACCVVNSAPCENPARAPLTFTSAGLVPQLVCVRSTGDVAAKTTRVARAVAWVG